MEQERGADYTAVDLIRAAKRDNNTRRPYLLVNPLQGKHVPVDPDGALRLFGRLRESLEAHLAGRQKQKAENLLIIAFAETATAIGAAVACGLAADREPGQVCVLQTTREVVPGAEYLYFSEVHSHAAAQKLVKDGLDRALAQADAVVFVEDEVTTGNTIRNLMNAMTAEFDVEGKRWIIASLLNGMTVETEAAFAADGIGLCYLVKSDNGAYAEQLKDYRYDGAKLCPAGSCSSGAHGQEMPEVSAVPGMSAEPEASDAPEAICCTGRVDLRKTADGRAYAQAAKAFARQVAGSLLTKEQENILVLGTEEFMYPGLAAAKALQEKGAQVRFHATTRSPILPSSEAAYPLHRRWQLRSFYEEGRTTFVYDLQKYDRVVVVTDGDPSGAGAADLAAALAEAGNDRIHIFQWT